MACDICTRRDVLEKQGVHILYNWLDTHEYNVLWQSPVAAVLLRTSGWWLGGGGAGFETMIAAIEAAEEVRSRPTPKAFRAIEGDTDAN